MKVLRKNASDFLREDMYNELVDALCDIFKKDLTRIVLYGSVSRGSDTPESDIDVAVFLNSHMDPGTEDQLSDAVVDLNLKYDKVFSVIDIDNSVYRKWRDITPFYQNVDKEGIVLWKEQS